MKTLSIFLAATAVIVMNVTVADARPIELREHRQEMRIHQGLRRGDLTRMEARRLQRGERRLDRAEAFAWRDGRLSPGERHRLNRMLDRQSRRIHRLRHNGRCA